MKETTTAKLKYLHITPRKVRSVADLIRNLSVNDAEAQLYLSKRRSGDVLLKLLRSAIADAKQTLKAEPKNLFVKEIRVDQGPRTKRWTPRARGSASMIEKKMSHVTIVLGVSELAKDTKYTFIEKPKKKKESHKEKKKKDDGKEKMKEEKKTVDVKSGAKEGLFRRTFSRKSV